MKNLKILIFILIFFITNSAYGAYFYSGIKFQNEAQDGYIASWTSTGNQFKWLTPAATATNLGVGTGDSPQFAGIELGHASDTTIARADSGEVDIEGNQIYHEGDEDTILGAASLDTNMWTFLQDATSAKFFDTVTDESGSGAVLGGTSPTISTPTLVGAIDMEDYLHLEVNASITNETGTGITDTVTVDAGADNHIGHCMHIDSDGEWVLADADSTDTMPCMAISLSDSEGAIQVIRQGKMSCTSCTGWPADSETWDEGEFIYASTTSGYLTHTAPSGAGDVVQKVGIVVSVDPDIVYFFFSPEETIIASP